VARARPRTTVAACGPRPASAFARPSRKSAAATRAPNSREQTPIAACQPPWSAVARRSCEGGRRRQHPTRRWDEASRRPRPTSRPSRPRRSSPPETAALISCGRAGSPGSCSRRGVRRARATSRLVGGRRQPRRAGLRRRWRLLRGASARGPHPTATPRSSPRETDEGHGDRRIRSSRIQIRLLPCLRVFQHNSRSKRHRRHRCARAASWKRRSVNEPHSWRFQFHAACGKFEFAPSVVEEIAGVD